MAEEPPSGPAPTRQRQVEAAALDRADGIWRRAVALVLEHYCDTGAPLHEEVDTVVCQVVLLIMGQYFDSDDFIMLSESARLRLPSRLTESADVRQLLGEAREGERVERGDCDESDRLLVDD